MNEIIEALENDDLVLSKDFTDVTISGFDFSKVEFECVTFNRCNLIDCKFESGYFHQVRFEKCDLSNSKLENAYFKEATFDNCKLVGANLHNSTMWDVNITDSVFRYANFAESSWRDGTITQCDMREVSFADAKLLRTKLKDVNLSGGDFFKSVVKGIDFSQCDIEAIVLSENLKELKGTKINAMQAAGLIGALGIKVI